MICVALKLVGDAYDSDDEIKEVNYVPCVHPSPGHLDDQRHRRRPAIAFAATNGSNAPTPTVTTLVAPKGNSSGHGFTLTARVAPSTASGNSARHTESTVTDLKAGKGKKGGPTHRKGTGKKGKGRSSGKGHGPRHGAETGSVTFLIDGKSLKPVPLARGRAAEKIDLAPGNHTATASYSGDNNYRSSQSTQISFTVK